MSFQGTNGLGIARGNCMVFNLVVTIHTRVLLISEFVGCSSLPFFVTACTYINLY